MDFMLSRLFWGLYIILIGVLLLLKSMLYPQMPVFRIAAAGFFILLGLSLLMSKGDSSRSFISSGEETTIFGNTHKKPRTEELHREYSNIFGQQVIDLREIELTENRKIEVNCIFGSSTIILPHNQNVTIKVSSAFGSATLPDNSQITFGDHTYKSPAVPGNEYELMINASVVFGSLEVEVRH